LPYLRSQFSFVYLDALPYNDEVGGCSLSDHSLPWCSCIHEHTLITPLAHTQFLVRVHVHVHVHVHVRVRVHVRVNVRVRVHVRVRVCGCACVCACGCA